jgi:hypothetical protein
MTHDDSQTYTPAEAVLADDTSLSHDQNEEQAAAQPLVDHRLDGRLEGWGPNERPDLSPEQVARLQEHDEQVADADFGGLLKGDMGNAEIADESKDAPQTKEPDTSLGHEGGKRYDEFAAGAGEQA